MSNELLLQLWQALGETLYMVITSTTLAVIFGLPIGIMLFNCKAGSLKPNAILYKVLSFITNTLRSIPFIILLALLIPITRLLVGSSIGSTATIVPLTIGAIPFFARLAENIFNELPQGLVEAGIALGAKPWQIIQQMLLPEALPALVNAITVTTITLVSYSAMAGAVGGGGLGALAIDYGYQRFEFSILITTVIILIAMVQLLQAIGDKIANYFTH